MRAMSWQNWSGVEKSVPKQWLKPQTEAELIQMLRQTQGIVRVTGASHSFTGLCRTDDVLVSLDGLSGVVRHDATTQQATVWAGTRLHDLGQPLWECGQALTNQGDVNPQSIGGACGTSTHGTGVTLGSFSSMVRGVRLITVAGDVIDADAEHNAEVFHAAKTSLGALGIITQVTLQNRAAYHLLERERVEDLESVLQNIQKYNAENRHFEFFCFPKAPKVIVKTLNETTQSDTAPPRFSLPIDPILNVSSYLADKVPYADGFLQRMLVNLHSHQPRVARSYVIFPSERTARFNEMEYEVPQANGPACVREIVSAIQKSNIRTLFPLEYRNVAADDAWLSPMYGRATTSISVHQHYKVDYRSLFELVEPIFWKYGGRPHWGKLHSLDAERLAPLYPHWADFQAVRQKLDPECRLLNPYLRHILLKK